MSKYKKILLVSALMMSANYALAISKGRATRLVNESGVGVYLNAAQKAKIAEELSASNIPNTRGDNLSKAIDFINSHSIVTAKKAAAASGAGLTPPATPPGKRGRAGEHTPVILGAPGGSPQKQVRSATGTTERASRTAENADSANLASRLELQISNSDDSSYSDDFESDDRS